MTQLVIAWLRLVSVITLVFLGVYGADQSKLAQNVIIDSEIPTGSVEENDAIVAGQEVVIDGDVEGDLLILAIDATINGNVFGSVISTAENVNVNGAISGSLYTVGRGLTLGNDSSVGRNVYFLVLRLVTAPDSIIQRDLVGVSLSAKIGGAVGRDFKAVIGLLELLGQIAGSDADAIEESDESSAVPARASDNDNLWVSLKDLSSRIAMRAVGGAAYQPFWPFVSYSSGDYQKSMPKQNGFQMWARITLEEFVLLFLTGMFMVWRYSNQLSDWSDMVKAKPLKAAGFGFIGIVVAVNVAILSIITVLLILTVGFGLGFASLWKLAFVFWGLAFSAVGLASTSFYLFVCYGSKLIVAYMLSRLAVGLISEGVLRYRYLIMFFGLLIYVLLQSLPYVGSFLNILVILVGLGSVWLVHRQKREFALIEENQLFDSEYVQQ